MNPYDQPYNDEVCVRCGAELPEHVEPGTPQDEGWCGERCREGQGWIANLRQLADHVGASYDEAAPFEVLRARVARRLYKDTECGIGFAADLGGVSVSGYCEGDVGECPDRRLAWGFWADDFDAQVAAADQDGIDLWNATHGCHECAGETEDAWEEYAGQTFVRQDCPGCGGKGVVL